MTPRQILKTYAKINMMTQAQAYAAIKPILQTISDQKRCTLAQAWSLLPVGLLRAPSVPSTPEQRKKWRVNAKKRYVPVKQRDNTAIQARRLAREQKRLEAIKQDEERTLIKKQRAQSLEVENAWRIIRKLNVRRNDADPAWLDEMRAARAYLARVSPKPVRIDNKTKAELDEVMLREAIKAQEADGWIVE